MANNKLFRIDPEDKLFTVVFSRGQGNCYDAVTYVVLDTDIENVKKRAQEYFAKHYSTGKWSVAIYDDTSTKGDEEGFYCVAEYYS